MTTKKKAGWKVSMKAREALEASGRGDGPFTRAEFEAARAAVEGEEMTPAERAEGKRAPVGQPYTTQNDLACFVRELLDVARAEGAMVRGEVPIELIQPCRKDTADREFGVTMANGLSFAVTVRRLG